MDHMDAKTPNDDKSTWSEPQAAELSTEQRRLIEDYLSECWANEEYATATSLWTGVIQHHRFPRIWSIAWLAQRKRVDEPTAHALLAGVQLLAGQGEDPVQLLRAADPWGAFEQLGIKVRKASEAQQAATRARYRAAYDEAIQAIEASRRTHQFDNSFHRQIADAVFDACYRAFKHQQTWVEERGAPERATTAELRAASGTSLTNTVPPRLHVVSAPMGAGKTTFTIAFIIAMTRMSDAFPKLPYGCVLLVDQIPKAEAMYRELTRFLPERVAVWTTDHDIDCTEPAKVRNPAARFHVDQLQDYPVLIVTHAFFKGPRGDKARTVLVDRSARHRALTVVDEQMQDVAIYDVKLSSAEAVREAIQEQGDDTVAWRMQTLAKFMMSKVFEGPSLEKPNDDEAGWRMAQELAWFTTPDARAYETANRDRLPAIQNVFGLARCMAQDYAFIGRHNKGAEGTYFVGYEPQHAIFPGMVLLDATSDIDGVTPLSPWRDHIEVPQGRYDNLSIVHVQSCTDEALGKFLGRAANRLTYSNWMKQVILEHMESGQLGLVVCKKALLDDNNIPGPHPRDPGAEESAGNPPFGWDLDGRKLGVTYWGGAGLGSNVWMDAEVVFLFDEFYLRRQTAIGGTQGLQLAPTSEGAIASMTALNSKSAEVTGFWEGHLLRWNKQMGLRGRGRIFDEHGICGKQKLIFTGDYERLLLYKDRMFPGATLTTSREETPLTSWKTRRRQLLEILSNTKLTNIVTTNEIANLMQVKAWRDVSKEVMAGDTRDMLKALGWTYVSKQGRGGSWFERIGRQDKRADDPGQAIAAE
jgi:hypothetical protein